MNEGTQRTTRRTVLKATGLLSVTGLSGLVSARSTSAAQQDTMELVGEVAIDGATEVDTKGQWAYVATGDGFAVVNWLRPSSPEVVTTVDAPGTEMVDVKVDDGLLAISGERDEENSQDNPSEIGTQFYDVRDPTNPRLLRPWSEMPEGVHNAFIDDDVAYVTRERPFTDSSIKILDVSDTGNPELLSEWRVEDVDESLSSEANFVHDMYVRYDRAYVAYWDAGTWILDVSDPADPVAIGNVGTLSAEERATFASPGNIHYVQPSPDGNYLYAGAETYEGESGGIDVYDISDLDNTQQVATIEAEDRNEGVFPDTSHNFDVRRDRLYTSWYNSGLRVYDITDPSNPQKTLEYDPEGASYWGANHARDYVLASDIGSRLQIFREDRGSS